MDVQVQQNSSSLKGSGSVLSGEWLEGDQGSGRKAVVRKESAGTQDCVVPAERHVMWDMEENMEELTFFPSAVSDSAVWYEPQFTCDRQCRRKVSSTSTSRQ